MDEMWAFMARLSTATLTCTSTTTWLARDTRARTLLLFVCSIVCILLYKAKFRTILLTMNGLGSSGRNGASGVDGMGSAAMPSLLRVEVGGQPSLRAARTRPAPSSQRSLIVDMTRLAQCRPQIRAHNERTGPERAAAQP